MKLAITTGGGDAPGLNAVVRAAVLSARRLGWEVIGLRKGYEGALDPNMVMPLDEDRVRDITSLGGTILGTTNRADPFAYPVREPDGTTTLVDRSADVVEGLRRLEVDCLLAIGGDGSLGIAHRLSQLGVSVIGVPKTIDNDLESTVVTFGFDTAVTTATEALDRLRTTAEAHERVMVVEVMGRTAGWIALNAGVSASADVVLIPEIPFRASSICTKVMEREAAGLRHSLVVVAEGAQQLGGMRSFIAPAAPGSERRLGGIGATVQEIIEQGTGKEVRTLVLGHLQRGGSPTTFDRLIALRFGAAAVRAAAEGRFGVMVALAPPTVDYVDLEEAIRHTKLVPLDCDTIQTARSLGICLGD